LELIGKVVNRLGRITHEVDRKRELKKKGRIGLQADYAEMMYRDIRIEESKPDSKPAP
jgi:hypothetical protein